MNKLEQHDREHCNIKGCGTCDTVVHKIFDQIRENQKSMNHQPIFSPDMPKLPQHVEEKWIEKLSAIEHQRWSNWQKYLHAKCLENTDGSLTIINTDVLRWNRLINTHYDFLSEKEKESDREQVRRYLPIIATILEEERLKAFLLGYEKGNNIQIDWKYLNKEEQDELINLIKEDE